MCQDWLRSLSLLCVEAKEAKEMNVEELINENNECMKAVLIWVDFKFQIITDKILEQ